VVVLDAQTGEVLALANYPSFTPADRRNLSGAQLRNRALTDTFEPGSTMKPFIAAWAMETGRVTPNTVIQTAPGHITVTGSTIRDAHPHGALTVAEVIQKSSNVGTVRMAMQMQPREMWELFTQVGFGQKPQLAFPGAVTGRLRPYKTWRPIEQATMSYGYGLSASLFQLARAYTVFAHDGELIGASLVKSPQPAAGIRVLSPKTAQAVREMLFLATSAGGTAPKAQAIGYSVGGKTGTAYKQEGKGYADRKYRSWFVGMAPIHKPRIVVAVMVDEPSAGKYYGGDVAAPVFSEVVQQTLRTLGVPPDIEVRPQIVTHNLPAEEESF
jgi:cell division protein FtsI (penicillin-binding protein 3)